jgi:hypothetical protein
LLEIKKVLFDPHVNEQELNRQLKANVCMRIQDVGQLLGGGNSSHTPLSPPPPVVSKDNLTAGSQTNEVPAKSSKSNELAQLALELAAASSSSSSSSSSLTSLSERRSAASEPTSTETANFQRAWILSSVAQKYL